MGVASQDTVILFNYRGPSEDLDKLVFVSGRKDDSGQPRDGVKALHTILNDAVAHHDQTGLKIPKKAIIKMKSKRYCDQLKNSIILLFRRWIRN